MKSIWKAFCKFLDFFCCFKKGIKKSYSAIHLSNDFYDQPLDDECLMSKSEAKSLASSNIFITEQTFDSNRPAVQPENDPQGLKTYCYYGQLIYQQNRETVLPSISEIIANKAVTFDIINEEKPPESEHKANPILDLNQDKNATLNNPEKSSENDSGILVDDLYLNSVNTEEEKDTTESLKEDELNDGFDSLVVTQLKSNTSQEFLNTNESLPESVALKTQCPSNSMSELDNDSLIKSSILPILDDVNKEESIDQNKPNLETVETGVKQSDKLEENLKPLEELNTSVNTVLNKKVSALRRQSTIQSLIDKYEGLELAKSNKADRILQKKFH